MPENKFSKNDEDIQKHEEAFTDQIQDDLSIRVNKDKNRVNKTRIYESTLTIDNKLNVSEERENSFIQQNTDMNEYREFKKLKV